MWVLLECDGHVLIPPQISMSPRSRPRTTSAPRMSTLPWCLRSSRLATRKPNSMPVSSSSDRSTKSESLSSGGFLRNAYRATDLVCDRKRRFVSISPIYSPASSGSHDNVFITRSYDATSHFETVCDDVKEVWRRAIGEELVLKKREDALQAE